MKCSFIIDPGKVFKRQAVVPSDLNNGPGGENSMGVEIHSLLPYRHGKI
jgi:hypothetical protein